MSRTLSMGFLALFCSTLFAATPFTIGGSGPGVSDSEVWDHEGEIRGRYVGSEDKTLRLNVDETYRVKSNLAIINNATGERLPIQFPHHIKLDELTDRYTAAGYFNVTFYTNLGPRVCQFPVRLEGELFNQGQALDVTLTHPSQAYLDPYGNCRWVGQSQALLGFTKMKP